MNDKKQRLTILIISILVLVIGMSYAYYSAVVQGTGNANAEASGKTATIGEVEFNGTKTFVTTLIDEIYPGFIGIQEFTISPYKDGTGIYEVDLQASVPEAFGDDIRISVYKTSDKANNNVTRTEGELTINNNQYTKQDILTINGVPEKVYEGTLKTTNLEVVEQLRFTILNNAFTTPSVTPDGYYTYYAVYEYLDNGDQNNQQGLDFEGKFTVRYVTDNEYNAASYITSLVADASKGSINVIDNGTDASGCTNTLAYDDYGNLRYVGTNPCNYVSFNGESPSFSYSEYMLYIEGIYESYDDLDSCNNKLSASTNIGLSAECIFNTETNKYDQHVEGIASILGTYTSEDDCLNSESYQTIIEAGKVNVSCRKTVDAYNGGWRIIGVVDGKLKLIRSEKIGDYSWDSSEPSVNSGNGINQWGESGSYRGADLMKLLNPGYEDNTGSLYTNCVEDSTTHEVTCELENESSLVNNSLYWSSGTGNCYNNASNGYTTCDFTNSGLKSSAKNMIDNHMWYLGALSSTDLTFNVKQIYDLERANINGKICSNANDCNDDVVRTTRWWGYVGLNSVSDIGYSIGGSNRINCITNSNLSADVNEKNGCLDASWLRGSDYLSENTINTKASFLLNPGRNEADAFGVIIISSMYYGKMEIYNGFADAATYVGGPILPTVYLKSSVKISGGNGSPTNPFVLE